jgi:hypothetical protein
MIARALLAVVGAGVITAGLLLAMDAVTTVFRADSGERYFRIADVFLLPGPDRPVRPPAAERQPEMPAPVYSNPDVRVTIETPAPTVEEFDLAPIAPEEDEGRSASPDAD